MNVLERLISQGGGFGLLDGGLATELERRGADINDPLWSASCLLDEARSSLIREVHLDYYRAGADIGISSSYQATIPGFLAKGLSEEKAKHLLRRSVQLTAEARELFWSEHKQQQQQQQTHQKRRPIIKKGGSAGRQQLQQQLDNTEMEQRDGVYDRPWPLVAASVGCYGAFLADGSEYRGVYGERVTEETLVDFHRQQLQVLLDTDADLIAFETVPSLMEVKAIVRLLEELDAQTPAWISCNSVDGSNLPEGSSFQEAVAVAARSPKVAAIGINCTAPQHILGLVRTARKMTEKVIVVYPNSGEQYDDHTKEWNVNGGSSDHDFVRQAPEWWHAGAQILGGCCRTTPATVRGLHRCLCGILHLRTQQQQPLSPPKTQSLSPATSPSTSFENLSPRSLAA